MQRRLDKRTLLVYYYGIMTHNEQCSLRISIGFYGDFMSKRILSRDLIVSEAFKMIDERGTDSFSVRGLAAKLGVRVSSLYNHIENEYDLLLEVSKRAAALYADIIATEVVGQEPEEASYKAGDAFKCFMNEHRYLYELLLSRRWMGNPEYEKSIEEFTHPIFYLLDLYGVKDKAAREHAYIAMRVVTHGFSYLDSLGVFDGLSIDTTESYHKMIKSVIDMMKESGKKS